MHVTTLLPYPQPGVILSLVVLHIEKLALIPCMATLLSIIALPQLALQCSTVKLAEVRLYVVQRTV